MSVETRICVVMAESVSLEVSICDIFEKTNVEMSGVHGWQAFCCGYQAFFNEKSEFAGFARPFCWDMLLSMA